jgi:hypothetical protein
MDDCEPRSIPGHVTTDVISVSTKGESPWFTQKHGRRGPSGEDSSGANAPRHYLDP